MSDLPDKKQPSLLGMRVKFALVSLMTMIGTVGLASAATINDSVGPLLDALVLLFVPILALVVAMIPILVTLAIVSFILGILAAVLTKIRM
jgi:hypothetical protein